MDYQVVCFGETLFDVLGATSTPGGAPFNVAYHLKQSGITSYLISCVGNDEYGLKILDVLQEWGLNTEDIAISNQYSTGKAIIKEGANHQPEFELLFPAAWDYIEWQQKFKSIIEKADAFVFGSLISRHSNSFDTLLECLKHSALNVFDINIRPPHFSKPIIETLLLKANILKLNVSELNLLSKWFGIDTESEPAQVNFIRERFNITEVIITKGEDGASYYGEKLILHQEAIKVKVADTIGSGDAFLAGFLSKRLQKNTSVKDCLLEAARKGAFVASQFGACPAYNDYINH